MALVLQCFVTLLVVHLSYGNAPFVPVFPHYTEPEPPCEPPVIPHYPHIPQPHVPPHQVPLPPPQHHVPLPTPQHHVPSPSHHVPQPPHYPHVPAPHLPSPHYPQHPLPEPPCEPPLIPAPTHVVPHYPVVEPPHILPHYPEHEYYPQHGPEHEYYPQHAPEHEYYPQFVGEYEYYPQFVGEYEHYPQNVYPHAPLPESPDVFPKEFSFGIASSAHTTEGAWDQDCKSEDIWDRWLHTNPHVVVDYSNGDVGADAYNHVKEDVEILNNLTARHYKFSISWSRILYDGCGEINPAGIAHYKQLIHLLKLNQIEPIVTMYDGDLPQALEDQGGFLSPKFVEWYTAYVKVLFDNFGDDVKYWLTFMGPTETCTLGYGSGAVPPGYKEDVAINQYICGHNLLKAHASAYHLYDDCYRPTQKGKVSIALSCDAFAAATDCEADQYALESKLQFQLGWFAHPIYIGDYPPRMVERIRYRYEYEGFYESRLPVFTHSEIEYIKNTHDFFALNYEMAFYVSAIQEGYKKQLSFEDDVGAVLTAAATDGDLATSGIRPLLKWIQENYHNPSVFITSDGFSVNTRDLNDDIRINYLKKMLKNLRAAMIEDCVRVYGYTYYSYIDVFACTAGYTITFGLYDVEFSCPQKTRTARKSAAYFQHLSSTGCIEDTCPAHYYHHY